MGALDLMEAEKQRLLINEVKINWRGNQSYYFYNPKHPQADLFKKTADRIPFLKAHIYLYTSSGSKICLLSKKALLSAAGQANQNLQASSKDKWLISLPLFHVGGLSVLARSFLSNSAISFQNKVWNPSAFQKQIGREKITLSSLVPTQLYDLVQQGLKCPASLRALLVGGDHLLLSLYKKARKLGWPLLPCYGATETSSHIAAADLNSLKKKSFPDMKLLKDVKVYPVKQSEHDFLKIKTAGLLTAYFDLESRKLYDPKDDQGRLLLEDSLSLKKKALKIKSQLPNQTPDQIQNQIKILGEKINFKALSLKLQRLLEGKKLKAHLAPLPDERRGWSLALIGDIKNFEAVFSVLTRYNQQAVEYERIQSLYFLDQEPQSQFVKVKTLLLVKKLGF